MIMRSSLDLRGIVQVDELLRTASDMLPEMRAVTGQLMGIKGALQRIAVAKSHTMQASGG